MLDPQLGHLTWRHGTPLVWGIFVPHFGQTHWLGPPIACLPPPLPLPCPLWLIFPPRPKTCCQIKMWLSFQDSHSFSSSSFFFAESNMFQVLSIALQHLLLLFHGRYRLIWSWPTSRGGSLGAVIDGPPVMHCLRCPLCEGVGRRRASTTLLFPYRWLLTISVFSGTWRRRRSATQRFPYNWLLVISVFSRFRCYFIHLNFFIVFI